MRRLLFAFRSLSLAVLLMAAAQPSAPRAQDAASPRRPAPPARASAAPDPAATVSQYCVTCHNARLKSGGLQLDPATLNNVASSAGTWEKVVRKLRTRAMPPPGAPRPDEKTYDAVATRLEASLDQRARAHPNLGTLPLVHRLSRTEYRNAIRDLLALDALPLEMDIDLLLPPDNVSSGFDNIADLLFISPTNLERYLDTAQRISRLAVGDPSMPVMVNIHRLDAELPQDAQVDTLPFGTRGGIAVKNDFPVDATYVVKVELAGATRDPEQLEISVDGERVELVSLGGRAAGPANAGGRGRGAGGGGRGGAGNLEYRLPLAAGPHTIGVTFVARSEASEEATLRPRTRSRGTGAAVERVTISGPYDVTGPGRSASRQRIFTCTPATRAEEEPCARKILATLARRAYRRPVVDADLTDLMPFFRSGRSEGTFDRGIQRALERLLVSSQFLFRIEHVPDAVTPGATYRVSDLELASRLSFFLWSSIPDDELLSVAAAGRLSDPTMLDRQVRRMLADPKADALATNFAAQWLFLRDIDVKHPDEVLFQNFDESLRQAMRRETELFVASVFRENRPLTTLLTADYTFLNGRLAEHYGIPHVRGSYFRRVTLPPGSMRGGLLGQGSILTLTSYATRTSPVLRGKWVLENLLASPPPPPPPDVPALKTEGHEPGTSLTMREAMIQHRANPACASCHARMDPIGFAMENFDAIGRWRDNDHGAPIDVSGVFPGGVTFDGIAGLKRELVRQPAPFLHNVAERLLMYAVGRNLQYYDAPAVRAILRTAAPQRFTLASLVLGVVHSDPFRMRQKAER
jgi:mono/diheme cytochrome c family protein